MTLNFDFSKTAVLSIHMQNDIILKEGKLGNLFGEQVEARNVIENGKLLIENARSNGIPIIHVGVRFQADYSDLNPSNPLLSMIQQINAIVEGTWGGDTVEELKPREGEIIISHKRVSPFHGTELGNLLKNKGIESLILFGVATNIAVESTARVSSDEGFNVYVVEDCCSAQTIEAHQASIATLGLLTNIISLSDILQEVKI